jgi:lambda repressor-like predicted transcriptional regulator
MPRLAPDDPRLAAPDFPHGRERGYRSGCRCTECRSAHSALNGYGTGGVPVDASEARAHVEMLLQRTGASLTTVAHAAGLTRFTVRAALTKPRVHRATVDALLATTVEAVDRTTVGRKTLHDIEPVQRHIRMLLRSEDCTMAAVAAAAGMSLANVKRLMDEDRAGVYIETQRAILALTPYRVRRNASAVSKRRAATRLRALQANGWSLRNLAHRCGYAGDGFPFMGTKSSLVAQEIDRAVEALYQELGDTPGPSPHAAERARRDGYYPPIHYDDEMRLIPDSIPQQGWQSEAEQQERARRWLRIMGLTLAGEPENAIALALRVNGKQIERVRKVVGLRLNANGGNSVLTDTEHIKPGQERLVEHIAAHTALVAIHEPTDVLDQVEDHVALWDSLVAGAEEIHAGADQETRVAA